MLYSALNYSIIEDKKGFSIVFNLGKYGAFVDQGVKGADPSIIDRWTANGKKNRSSKSTFEQIQFQKQIPTD